MNFLEIILGTPIWVWIILVFLLWSGITALKGKTVSLFKLAIMPTIFISWSIYSLQCKYGFDLMPIGVWSLFWLIGLGIGSIISKRMKLSFGPEKYSVTFHGSWFSLLLSLSFFSIKYSLGATCATIPLVRSNIFFRMFELVATGAISGISLGRFLGLVNRYIKSSRD